MRSGWPESGSPTPPTLASGIPVGSCGMRFSFSVARRAGRMPRRISWRPVGRSSATPRSWRPRWLRTSRRCRPPPRLRRRRDQRLRQPPRPSPSWRTGWQNRATSPAPDGDLLDGASGCVGVGGHHQGLPADHEVDVSEWFAGGFIRSRGRSWGRYWPRVRRRDRSRAKRPDSWPASQPLHRPDRTKLPRIRASSESLPRPADARPRAGRRDRASPW